MPEVKQVALVILAAGGSKRLGSPKQNLEFRGKTLLQATIDAAIDASISGGAYKVATAVFVVLGANESVVRERNNFDGCEVVVNSNWMEGLGSSIRCALQSFEGVGLKRYDAVLFTVADLAFVHAAHFEKLLKAFSATGAPVVCSAFDSNESDQVVYGVPALFDRELFPQLLLLSGDTGARKIIMRYTEQLVSVPVNDASHDIDTTADYLRLLGR